MVTISKSSAYARKRVLMRFKSPDSNAAYTSPEIAILPETLYASCTSPCMDWVSTLFAVLASVLTMSPINMSTSIVTILITAIMSTAIRTATSKEIFNPKLLIFIIENALLYSLYCSELRARSIQLSE
jgi:hypothetical protein